MTSYILTLSYELATLLLELNSWGGGGGGVHDTSLLVPIVLEYKLDISEVRHFTSQISCLGSQYMNIFQPLIT